MDKKYEIFLQLLRAQQIRDPVATSRLSLHLAWRCLLGLGGNMVGIATQSSRDEVPPVLLHLVKANSWVFLLLDLLWVRGRKVLSEGVVLMPGLTEAQAAMLAPYSDAVKLSYLRTDDDLVEALRGLRPDDYLAEVNLSPQSFLLAVKQPSSMIAAANAKR